MRLVEETLDGLIKLCARQLFDTTDHPDNAAYPCTKGGSQWEESGGGTDARHAVTTVNTIVIALGRVHTESDKSFVPGLYTKSTGRRDLMLHF